MFAFIKKIALLSLWCNIPVATNPLPVVVPLVVPVVVMHGVESSKEKMIPFCDWLSDTFQVKVFNLEIGNGEKTSLYTPLLRQLAELCETIYDIKELKNGFHFIGMSQGGLLARGYVERCNIYPVVNLITLVSPHGGEFLKNNQINMYSDFIQEHLSVASYWRDPLQLETYLTRCIYLPLLNNELESEDSTKQAEQMKLLDNFVMIWSPNDQVLNPAASGKFSFLAENLQVIPLEETHLYKKDLLGLKYLNEQNKLHQYETNCSHVDHRNPGCYSQLHTILRPYIGKLS